MKPFVAALLGVFCPPLAAQVVPGVPGAGDILQQIAPLTLPAPSPSRTGLSIERRNQAELPPGASFLVQTIQITGNSLIDTATLHTLVADGQGKNLTLAQLVQLATRISTYYKSHGYLLARAIIPAQTIASGIVRIEVIESAYGQIILANSSRVNDALLHATLAPLQSGQVIGDIGLEHALLLLSDTPGVNTAATLKPGERIGTSDLLVSTTPNQAVTGNMALDNYGNRYTGRVRLGSTVNVINPLQHGDVLSVSGISSGGGLNYARLGYETLINGQGYRLGGAYSALRYELGGPLTALKANGKAQVQSLWAKHPLVRSRDFNLYGQLQFDRLQLRDHLDAVATKTDRHLANWTLSLAGDARDALLSGGIDTWSLSWTAGRVGFDNADAQLADGVGAGTQGTFSKWNANFARLQSLSARNGLYLAFSGQWANGNLDSSQKMAVGGPYTVRGYDIDAVSGDTGYLVTAEVRHDLGSAWGGQWQAVAFMDSAHISINRNARRVGRGVNSTSLSGAGLGLNWAGPQQWRVKTYIATPIGSTPTLVANSASARAWVELIRGF